MDQIEKLDAFLAAPVEYLHSVPKVQRSPPAMQPFDRKRHSLTHLRPRHLVWVEELGIRKDYDRSSTQDYFSAHYNFLFGPLRPKIKETPSDELRKWLIVSMLLDLVGGRRAEYAQERAARNHNPI
jgi:hypothetical protein